MRAMPRAASAALLGTAVLASVFWAPPAATARPGAGPSAAPAGPADGRFQVQVIPRVVAPGRRVTLSVRGCAGATSVSSGVFDTVRLDGHSSPTTVGVDADAQSGAVYQVRFRCADGTARAVGLTITGRQSGPPRHGVRAGTGGSFGGFDLQQIAVGALLLAGALWLAYRRSSRHGTGGPAPGEPTAPARRPGS